MGGAEWLSWTVEQRADYVRGYLDGYSGAWLDACRAATELLVNKVPYRPGDENLADPPLSHCISRRPNYSAAKLSERGELIFGPYSETITQMYLSHPDSRSAPYLLLIGELSDGKANGAEQLYQAQKNLWPNARIADEDGTDPCPTASRDQPSQTR
jgi:hypothetical protein